MSLARSLDRLPAPLARLRRPIGRIAAFGVLPAVSLLSNLVVLPVLSARFGEAGWSSVLLGQSIGAAASVVCALTWPMEGPHLVSRTAPGRRAGLYASSVRQRAVAVLVVGPVVVALCLVARPAMPLVCVLSAVAIQLNALSPAWYFVGVSRPSSSLVAEGAPRLVVNIAAIALVVWLPLWTYPAALVVGMLATLVIASALVRRPVDAEVESETGGVPGPPRERSRVPLLAVVARGADAGYSYLTGPLVALVMPSAYPLYAAVDRLSQSLVNVMGTVTQGLTAWISEGRSSQRRVSGAVVLTLAFAGVCLAVLSFTAPLLLRFLFAGTVDVGPLVAFLAAAVTCGAFTVRALGTVLLVPRGKAAVAYRVLLVGAVAGLPAIGLAAVTAGSVGALVAAAAVAWLLVAIQLTAGLRGAEARPPEVSA
ncbi:polysaccharide transporter, PST family [Geodermatophilus saharensis]|uniref:Polysaccharide transporter, PST family n=1 Tax=Geodermatophilus saharensis TaxID=1137994 RepID=A0A239IAC0_9ACTN|nr:hypothetical protein [Geodermatophilus saharensis]SNS90342.1 polysaccharide transporter, PST family [Geodermatophilus saharensis]